MKMKKKLYGILAFVLVALCALGFAFGFTACSGGGDDEDTVVGDGKDPIIGTWKGDVVFYAEIENNLLSSLSGDYTAETTIIVDENTFSLIVTIDIMGFSFENYAAIENAEWEATDTEGEYIAYANISGIDYDIPIKVINLGNGNYEMSLTTEIELVIGGSLGIIATFDDARVTKV